MVGAPENLSFLKRTSIALELFDRVYCVEVLVAVRVLAGVFLVGVIVVRCLAYSLGLLPFSGTIVGLVGI